MAFLRRKKMFSHLSGDEIFTKAELKRTYPRNHHLVETREEFVWMLAQLGRYLKQRITNADGTEEKPLLTVDTETYLGYEPPVSTARTKGKKQPKIYPAPVHDGEKWLGRVRFIQIGLDSFETEWKHRDKQFIVDVKELGEQLVANGLKQIFENNTLIFHNAKYDLGFLNAQLDIHPQKVLDTMLMSQELLAGDDMQLYRFGCQMKEYTHSEEFLGLTGMSFDEFIAFKEEHQDSDWSGDISEAQLAYAADDVRLLWFLYYRILDRMDKYVARYERNFQGDKGIYKIAKMEHKLTPVVTMMELRGVPFDKKRHMEYTVPILETKREAFKEILSQYPEFRVKSDPGVRRIVIRKHPDYAWEFVKDEAKLIAVTVRRALKDADIDDDDGREYLKETKFSVRIDEPADGALVYITWSGLCMKKWVAEAIRDCIPDTWFIPKFEIINLGSSDQLNDALSARLGVPIVSTKAKDLKQYAEMDYDLIRDIIDYKNAYDACKNFGRKLANFCTPGGRIYAQWNQMGTEVKGVRSGRMSSNNPNLMQVPARHIYFRRGKPGEENYDAGISALHLFRDSFVAPDGYVFVDADLSQIEPRITAEITQDERLLKALRNGEDLHGLTAQAVLNLPYAPSKLTIDGHEKLVRVWDDGRITHDATEEDKFARDYIGKTMNLAIGYGIGPSALAQFMFENTEGRVVWDFDTAKENITRYFEKYPGIRAKMDEIRWIVGKRLYKVNTLAAFRGREPFAMVYSEDGRPRRFCISVEHEDEDKYTEEELGRYYNPENKKWYSNEFKRKINKASLAAYNHIIQSSACDVFKKAVIGIDRRLNKLPDWDKWTVGLLGCVHDEVLVLAKVERAEEVAKILEEELLKGAYTVLKSVPAKVSVSIAKTWGKCK